MIVTALAPKGNSSKFLVKAKQGEFVMAISYTLRSAIWKFADAEAELAAAKELAEAIVSRHDPKLPFKALYIFAEHTANPSFSETIRQIRRTGIKE